MTSRADDAQYKETVDRWVRGDERPGELDRLDRIASRPGRHVTDRARRVLHREPRGRSR